MFDKILDLWNTIYEGQMNSHWLQVLTKGEFSQAHYKGYLLETYHYTKYNPQIQAHTSLYFSQNNYSFLKKYLSHAADEISHDNLAVMDLVRLGENKQEVLTSQPLPITTAFISLPLFCTPMISPLTYLAQLFFLEYLATLKGETIMKAIQAANIPQKAMSFLLVHAEEDLEHNELMKYYIDSLVKTDKDLEIFNQGMITSADIYFRMIDESFRNGVNRFS